MAVGVAHHLDQAGAGGVHGHRLQPAMGALRVDQHDFGPVGLGQPVGHRLGDAARGEILALGKDIARAQRRSRRGRSPRSRGSRPAGRRRTRAADCDRHVREMRRQGVGPGRGRPIRRERRTGPPPARLAPALARELTQRGSGGALQRHGRIVPRAVGRAVRHGAARVVVEMRGRVPAVAGHVDAAAEGEAIVDHHDLVVVARAGVGGGVEPGVDALVGHPAHQGEQGRAAEQGAQRADVPAQQDRPRARDLRSTSQRMNSPRVRGSPGRRSSSASRMRASKSQPISMIRRRACSMPSRAAEK